MKRILNLILLFSVAASASAQDLSKDLASCAAIAGELERLECFDNVARTFNIDGPVETEKSIAGVEKWVVSDTINPIDDSRTVTLLLTAVSGSNSRGNPVLLVVRCQSNKTELYINWGDYLGSDANVVTRVGSNKSETKNWGVSTDKQASFYPGSPIPFIKSLFNVEKLVAQVTPYNESPVTAIFEVGGLQSAAIPLMETCGWN